jgi:regulator of RNase E activity RraA
MQHASVLPFRAEAARQIVACGTLPEMAGHQLGIRPTTREDGMATESELAEVRPRLLGMIAEDRITTVRIGRPAPGVTGRFHALTDLCSTVSDVLDELGVGAVVPAHDLAPIAPGQRICGPAITLRYVPVGGNPGALYARGAKPLLADRELYGVGEAGDIGVFDCGGIADWSVLGGLSASWAQRLGIAGCVVDGGVRDVDSLRAMGFPVWSRGRTPITGRQRMEAVEINGTVRIGRARVRPGDLVVADGTGVCVIPAEDVDAVIDRCEESERAESRVLSLIAEGASARDVTAALPADQW